MQKKYVIVLCIVLCFITGLVTYNITSDSLQVKGVRTVNFRNNYKEIDEQLNFVTIYSERFKTTSGYSTFAFYSMDDNNKIDVYGKFEVINKHLLKLNNQNGKYYGVLQICDDNAVLITKDGKKYNFSEAWDEHYINPDFSSWHTEYDY